MRNMMSALTPATIKTQPRLYAFPVKIAFLRGIKHVFLGEP